MQSRKPFQSRGIAVTSAKPLGACILVLLLAACGHANTPAEGSPGAAATIAAPQASSAVMASNDDESDADDDGDNRDRLRTPPPGVLHYTIVLTGELHTTGKHKGEFRNATIKRKIEVTTRMQAHLANGTLAEVSPAHPKGRPGAENASAPMEALAAEMEKCNGDMACIMKVNAKRMANPAGEKAIRDASTQILGMIGRVAVWSRQAPCAGRMASDDDDNRVTWWDEVGEGYYKTGLDKNHKVIRADDTFDCMPASPVGPAGAALEAMTQGTRIYFDTQTGDYDITFGASAVDVAPTVNGKPGKPVQIGNPEIVLTGFSGAVSGKPFSGSQSLDVKSENGVPLHAEVNWAFRRIIPDP